MRMVSFEVARSVLALLCALALLLAGCAHRLAPAITVLNTSSTFLTTAHGAIVAAQDAESAQAESRETTRDASEAAGARTDVEYEPIWDAYHGVWLVWVAGRAAVEAQQAADAAGATYDHARVWAAVLRLSEAQERMRVAIESMMQRRQAR
jgi:hypothetical protein